ncbi:MAG: HlyD family efflux transporter periplasmic adaptor subunit [Anaerolineae bacterium]|nr:HlyD family efflux transporter periplasmic adaptor subunit [Anaerolineae bacterium]
MRKRQVLMGLLALATVGLLLFTGCGGTEATETVPADEVPVVASGADGKVVAEAVIEPARWSELRFDVVGDVAEVLVQEGDIVSEGDLLARLETTDLERAAAQAELSLSQAQVGLSQAQLRLGQLQEPPDDADIRQAEHAVEQAAAALKAAQLDLTAVLNSTLLNETLEDAQKVFEDRQHRYEARLEMYESGEEPDYWFVDQAQERLDDARLNLDRIRQQGNAQSQDARNAVDRARQSYQETEDALERLLEGADPLDVEAAQKDIEVARLDVEAAELSLEKASSNLENAQLVAPFAGTVVQVNVAPGDAVLSGEVALVLATLDRLQACTVDLTELDVARVDEGQEAVVTVDALSDVELQGHVTRIGLQSVDYRGDVTYPVTVELDEAAPELRWGMTAMVEIETQ